MSPTTTIKVAAQIWIDTKRAEGLSPSTVQAYEDRLRAQVLPALGQVRLRELSVGLLDRHLDTVRRRHGPALARQTRSVLSGICSLAARHDAIERNPCRDVTAIRGEPRKAPRSLTLVEVLQIREWLASDLRANQMDIADLVDFLLATGLRIGEACAVRWTDLAPDASSVAVTGTVVRVRGDGLLVKAPKTASGIRILELPTWCQRMLQHRQHTADWVFPSPQDGKLRDPSNTRRTLRVAFRAMGRPGLTSHVFRKTVASMMDDAGLPPRAAADQVGHAKPTLTMDVYFGRKLRATGAARVLEMFESDPPTRDPSLGDKPEQ